MYHVFEIGIVYAITVDEPVGVGLCVADALQNAEKTLNMPLSKYLREGGEIKIVFAE